MIRNEDSVGPNRSHYQSAERDLAAACVTVTQSLSLNTMLRGQSRVDFDLRFRILINQRSDSSRLRSGKKLAYNTARRQMKRKVVIEADRRIRGTRSR